MAVERLELASRLPLPTHEFETLAGAQLVRPAPVALLLLNRLVSIVLED